MNSYRSLVIAAATALLCAVVVLYVPLEGARLAGALPLCLLLPGYAVTVAAFGRRAVKRPQLLLLSIGMSLATLAIGSLILNYVPGGLRATSWAALLVLVVLGGCTIATLRRPPPADKSIRSLRPRVGPVNRTVLLGTVVAAVWITLVVVNALAMSWAPLPANNAIGYTQLWMLPSGGAKGNRIRIGVVSQEQHRVAYSLKVQFGRRQAPLSDRVSSRLVLKPGQERVLHLRVRHLPQGSAIPVTAMLFRRGDWNTVYRRVTGHVGAAMKSRQGADLGRLQEKDAERALAEGS
jgi:uncharacterized membrane protein